MFSLCPLRIFCLGKYILENWLWLFNKIDIHSWKTDSPNWWELHSYLSLWEAALSKDMAQRKISKPRLPEESNHITDLEATSKLPGKLSEKPASVSDPAASERSFKGRHLAPVIAIQKGRLGRCALFLVIMCSGYYQAIWTVKTAVLIHDESLSCDFTSEWDSFKLSFLFIYCSTLTLAFVCSVLWINEELFHNMGVKLKIQLFAHLWLINLVSNELHIPCF